MIKQKFMIKIHEELTVHVIHNLSGGKKHTT